MSWSLILPWASCSHSTPPELVPEVLHVVSDPSVLQSMQMPCLGFQTNMLQNATARQDWSSLESSDGVTQNEVKVNGFKSQSMMTLIQHKNSDHRDAADAAAQPGGFSTA